MKYFIVLIAMVPWFAISAEVVETYGSGNAKSAVFNGKKFTYSDSSGVNCTNAIVVQGANNPTEDKQAAYAWGKARTDGGVTSVIISGPSADGWLTYYEFIRKDGSVKTLCFRRAEKLI